MDDLKQRAERLIEGQDWGHSAFQIDHFIIGKAGPTNWGMFTQCLREIRGRVAALTPPKEPLWRRVLRRIGLVRPSRPLDDSGPQRGRELRRFVELAEGLKAQLHTEHGRALPVAWLDQQMWKIRITRMVLTEILATGRLSVNAIETILALPEESRCDLATTIEKVTGMQGFPGQLEAIARQGSWAGALPDARNEKAELPPRPIIRKDFRLENPALVTPAESGSHTLRS